MTDKLISVVVPCYYEEEVISETHRQLSEVLPSFAPNYELVYVNDGSKDRTLEILLDIQSKDPRVRVVSFSRNFGHQRAVTAGIDFANGDAVVLIDADLQDPPEVIGQMVEKWSEGYSVVYGKRLERAGETQFKKQTARAFYRLLNKMSEVPMPLDTGDFRLMDRQVVDNLRRMPERDRFIRGLVSWVGFKQTAVEYNRAERFAGVTKYPLRKMLTFAMDGLLSFSIQPLRVATKLGLFVAIGAMIGIIYALYGKFIAHTSVQGWTFTIVVILFLGGVQLLGLGLMGEYIGRIYQEIKRRPLYVVEETHGFSDLPSLVSPAPEVKK